MQMEFTAQLKRSKAIAPRPEFAERSRRYICALETPAQVKPWGGLRLALAFAFAALLLALATFSTPARPVLSSSLDPEKLANEFENLTVNIQLEEIRYEQRSDLTISSAIGEITDTRTKHLSAPVLEAEKASLPSGEETVSPVDALLEQVIR